MRASGCDAQTQMDRCPTVIGKIQDPQAVVEDYFVGPIFDLAQPIFFCACSRTVAGMVRRGCSRTGAEPVRELTGGAEDDRSHLAVFGASMFSNDGIPCAVVKYCVPAVAEHCEDFGEARAHPG